MPEGGLAALESCSDILLNPVFGGFLKDKKNSDDGHAYHTPEDDKYLRVKTKREPKGSVSHRRIPLGEVLD